MDLGVTAALYFVFGAGSVVTAAIAVAESSWDVNIIVGLAWADSVSMDYSLTRDSIFV
jgi:hypothetical protein